MMVEINKPSKAIPLITPGEIEMGDSDITQVPYSDIEYSLIKMGFKKAMCEMINLFFEPKTIEIAVTLMTKEDDVWQHNFIEDKDNSLCLICKENSEHIDTKKPKPMNTNDNKKSLLSDSSLQSNYRSSYEKIIKERESLIQIDQMPNAKVNVNVYSNSNSKHECQICYDSIPPSDQLNVHLSCSHQFCSGCWVEYLKEKILNGEVSIYTHINIFHFTTFFKVKNIKCMQYDCSNILPRNFIINLIKHNIILAGKYDKFYQKKMVLSNANMKFCPEKNCEGYGEKEEDNNKYITCSNGHQFCFICLKPWHGRKNCQKEIDLDFQKWKKKKLIKKCPDCNYWTEKIEGCNHMTCPSCQYEWCWLCRNHCGDNHFIYGSCIGLQFSMSNTNK